MCRKATSRLVLENLAWRSLLASLFSGRGGSCALFFDGSSLGGRFDIFIFSARGGGRGSPRRQEGRGGTDF